MRGKTVASGRISSKSSAGTELIRSTGGFGVAMVLFMAMILLAGGARGKEQSSLAEDVSMTLSNGQMQSAKFTVEKTGSRVLLWVRGRISLAEDEQAGAHALALSLNGTKLTPENVRVINKKEVYEGDEPMELFGNERGGWYLKGDSDE